jgi:hypothetical protein
MATVFDFDGDGDMDILGTEGVGSQSNTDLVWAENDGNGTFVTFTNIDSGPPTTEFPVDQGFLQGIHVDRFGPGGTGPLEIVLQWNKNVGGTQLITVPANPTIDQWTVRTISSTTRGEEIDSGDIDLDGDNDLYLGTEWLRNDGSSWTAFVVDSTTGIHDRTRLGDIDRDGLLDAAVGFAAGRLSWYEQPSTSPEEFWTEHVIDGTTIRPTRSLDLIDMDADGDLDVIAGETSPTLPPSTLSAFVFENVDGSGANWLRHTVYTGDEHHDGTQAFDSDGDGDLEIVSVGWVNGKVVLYENLALSAGNQRPTAVDDGYDTSEGVPLAIDAAGGVLAACWRTTMTSTVICCKRCSVPAYRTER